MEEELGIPSGILVGQEVPLREPLHTTDSPVEGDSQLAVDQVNSEEAEIQEARLKASARLGLPATRNPKEGSRVARQWATGPWVMR